jgi:exo-beta-1,3-glucanase (GH17 family)
MLVVIGENSARASGGVRTKLCAAGAGIAGILLCLVFWVWQGRPVALPDAPSPRLPCVSYAPFRGSQSPFDKKLVVPPQQIEADLRALAVITDCVRIYAVDQGLAEVPGIAERLGLQVLLGAWLRADPLRNAGEIATVVALANRYPGTVRAVIVGNEVLLRREMPAERLTEQIRAVAAAVPVPVSYADVWEFWLKHPEVAGAVDFITVHILPYWEDRPVAVDQAIAHVRDVIAILRQAFPGKDILIGETGWPSRGRMRRGALPGTVNQARFVREILNLAKREHLNVNLIEAIDQPWKRKLEGTVGGYWGMLDAARTTKFPLTGPVREHPLWFDAFAASAAITLLPIVWARRHLELQPAGWLLLALAAAVAACALVVAGREVVETSLGPVTWSIALARLAIAVATLVLTARVLLAAQPNRCDPPLPAVTVIEAIRTRRPAVLGSAQGALGLLRLLTLFGVAVTSLGLAFDGRYRDFPVAVYAPAVACFLVLAWRSRGCADLRGAREEVLLVTASLIAGGVVLGIEGLGNHQAVQWAGIVAASAGTVVLERLKQAHMRGREALQPDRPHRAEERRGGAELGVVEDKPGRPGCDGDHRQ